MSNGMKQTEIGEIPEDWEVVPLHAVANNITTKYADKNGRCVDMEHIEQETGRLLGFAAMESKASVKNHFKKGDVLFGKLRPYLRKYWKATFEGGCTTEILVIRNSGRISSTFLYYIVQQDSFIENSVASSFGTKMPRTSWKIVGDFNLALPPLPEQQKIAEILSTVDEKIAVIDDQLAKTAELKTGLMQRLLIKGIGHTTFKDSPLGEIPANWKVVQIRDIGEVKGGKRLPKGEELVSYDTGFPYIKAGDLKKGTVITTRLEYLTPEIQKQIKNYTISSDDTYITIVGAYIGDVGVIPEFLNGSNLTENAAKIHRLKEVNNRYLAYFLASELGKMQIKSAIGTGAQPKLALMRIQDFWFPKPSKAEQFQILEVLLTIDEKIQVLRDKKEHYQTLKRGLMQQLLTGKLRVRVTEDAVPA